MSGITGKEDISLTKSDIAESKVDSINTTKTLIFKHQANAGEMVINTSGVVTPTTSALNGFVQPDLSEIAALNLLINKNNIKVYSSRGVWLQQHDDFKVTGAATIQFVGAFEALGGALQNEIFTIYATPVRANTYLTTDFKKNRQEYPLPAGQTLLVLGREYEVGRHPQSQLGSIIVSRDGRGPQLRNVGNAAASISADGNFHEIDAGQGLGVSIQFNVPALVDQVVTVDFGVEYAGDFSMVGDIEAAFGAILKLADDVKDLGPFPISRYITATPSQVERRAFGNQVLDHENRVTALEAPPDVELYLNTGNGHGATNTRIRRFSAIQKDTSAGYFNYVDSATLGMSVTMLVGGLYHINYSDSSTGTADRFGISLNAAGSVGTNISALTYAQGKRAISTAQTGPRESQIGLVLRLVPGDIIRTHTDGTMNMVTESCIFQMIRIGA